MSQINVNTIASTSGTTLFDGVSVDQWRLHTNFSTNTATVTGWERPDDGYNAYVNGWTESSGIFSPSVTGLYQIHVFFMSQALQAGDGSHGLQLQISTDSGGNYDAAAIGYNGEANGAVNNGASFMYNANVTSSNLSTFRLKLITSSMASGTFIQGNQDQNWTAITLTKVAPAQ